MFAREIILLRHAQANPVDIETADYQRSLSPRGEAEAEAAGHWLKSQGAAIDRVVFSPALRAQQTAEQVLQVLGFCDARSEPRIYNATPGDLLAVLNEHHEATQILLVGHNPGLETLVALLVTGQSGDYRGMATAGIAWLQLAGAALEPGVARIKHFWSP